MILQLPSPGMEYPGETRQIGAEEFGISGKKFQCVGRGGEESFITGLLMGTDKGTQPLRHREGNEKVRDWDQPFELRFEPLPGFVVLTLGTVTISAGTEDGMDLAAGPAFIDGHAVNGGTACDDGLESFMMAGRHIIPVAGDIFGAVSAEYFCKGRHITAPS